MKTLSIQNFKGIKGPLKLDLKGSSGKGLNYLLYSENGGGKTSIAEAIRLSVCYPGWEERHIPPHIAGPNRQQTIQSELARYLHDGALPSFEIRIDDTIRFSNIVPYSEAETPEFFILGRQELIPSSRINLESLLNNANIRMSSPISDFLNDENIELLIHEVNTVLKDIFKEEISIVKLEAAGTHIGIIGITEQGHIGENIHTMLNESRQNLIKVLLFLCFLKCLPPSREKEDKCIVLDDIMSSLDLENRIILARYLISYGRDYQMIVLTHNIGFYNLMVHTAKIEGEIDEWKCVSLYRIEGKEDLYYPKENESVKELEDKFGGKIRPTDTEAINAMRKKLELLLHEFGKILTLGIQEETKDLIGHLVSAESHGYYCCVEGDNIKTGKDLLNKIHSLTEDDRVRDLREKIKFQFEKYNETNTMKDIAETIRHVNTYQKVVLHPGSHDQGAALSFSSEKEITISLDLMRKLEAIVNRSSASYPYFI